MSSPISSALEKLDGSLLALQSEVDCLRAGLEVSDEQLGQRLAEARDHAMAVRDLISAQRAGARWGDREALNQLIFELETAAQEKVNEERRTRLLELASEFEAGSIKHRFESRVSALNALREEAVAQLRADAALKDQEKVLPGPEAGEWLHWACNLQEDSDASTLDQLQRDFSAVAGFTGEMEESYWVPGTRAPVTASAPAARPAAPPVREAAPVRPAPPPSPPAPKPPAAVVAPPPAPKPAPAAVAPPPAPKPPAATVAPPPPAPKPAPAAAPTPAPKPAAAAPPAPPKPPAPVPPPAAAKPAEPAIQPDKKPAPAPTPAAPTRPQVAAAAAAVAMQQEKPAPTASAQATQPAASAKAAERPAKEAKPAEPARPSAQAKWQAAAPAPAKEPGEKKAVATATAAAPAVTPTRMKFCDKCGSTYPAQFNVCPIDTSPLRFADEPAAASPGRDGSGVAEKTAVAAGVAAVAAQASSKARAAEKPAPEKPRESAKVEVSEIRATLRPHDDEALVEEHKAADWQTLLRDKNWAALAANPVVLAAATLILILLVGGIVWKARRSHTTNDSVKAMEKAPEPAANSQPGLVTNSVAQPVSSTPSATTTGKPPDPNANKQNTQPGKDAQPKPDNPPQNAAKPAEVLNVPNQAPREVATAKPPANDPIEPPSSIPGALPNTSPNNLGAIAKDVPVAVPTLNQQKLRVSSGVAQAQLTRKVNPQYPPEAFQSRVHGTVVLQAVIGKDGAVKTVKVVSGPPMLVKSATEAVKQWRYKPFTLNGEAVEADTQINVNFSME